MTTTNPTYNGSPNYETWAVGMFLDGNYTGEGTYLEVLELAREHDEAWRLADALKSYVEESLPDLGGSIAADLLGAAMSEVDWSELAEHKLSEVAESD